MALELQSVVFASPDPGRDAEFWGAVLARSPEIDDDGIFLAGTASQVGLGFAAGGDHGAAKNRLHLHLTDGFRGQRDTIDACIAFGGRLLGNGNVPENSYAVMADTVGDEFCVIEDGNGYLTGCGPLGEVTCDGTRTAGHFWSEALRWPLVWEVGEERVIQSPVGGTKLAWSGDAVGPEKDRTRQFFLLTVEEQEFDREVDRLISLGALKRREQTRHRVTLRDPDGIDFVLRSTAHRPR
jgi:hypothetical protein